MADRELRIFISSTFQDLQEEREHLAKKIFPEIRALCRERGITFTEVDLRWGITEEEVASGRLIGTCLEEIDRCRPYFFGISGERYGYVPDITEIYKDPDLLRRYPWIEDAVAESASVIDLEFRHAALNDPSAATSARFYFRRPRRGLEDSSIEDEERRRIEELKNRVRDAGLPVENFREPGALGEMVYDELLGILKRDFSEAAPLSPLEQERARHHAFAASRMRAYIPNRTYLNRLNDWLASEAQPLVLYAESGSGKSSLVAFWCEQLRKQHPELFIIEHYVGIGARDSDHLGIIRHVMEEIKEHFQRAENIPAKGEELEQAFANWLGFGVETPLVLVLDGMNQLSGRALDLSWIPSTMPPGVRLLISTTVERTLVQMRARGWQEMGMQPLRELEREAVVVRFLSEYHKNLPPEQLHLISEDPKCSHPLFLRTLLEELRLHGMHEHLQRRLTYYLATTGTEDLFQRVLERLEEDHAARPVREAMSLLWASRGGLSETDLVALTGVSRLKLSSLLLGLDYHLVRRHGVLLFFHDYLRRAVEKRYLGEGLRKRSVWERLSEFFERQPVSLRASQELLHALDYLDDRPRVEDALSDIRRFRLMWESERFEVMRLWAKTDPDLVAAAYERALERWEREETPASEIRAQVNDELATLLSNIGASTAAERLQRNAVVLMRAAGDSAHVSRGLSKLAQMALHLGRSEESEQLAHEAERIGRDTGDLKLVSAALNNLGDIYHNRGDFSRALSFFREAEQITREVGRSKDIGAALTQRAKAHARLGDYDEALACLEESESIARQIGDRENICIALSNRGQVYMWRGDYETAMECFERHQKIADELGSRNSIAIALGNRGIVYASRGEYRKAMECFMEQERVARQIGARLAVAHAVGNRGNIHFYLGELDDAMTCFITLEREARELGDRTHTAMALSNRGAILARRGQFETALDCYAEAEAIQRELGNRKGLGMTISNRGNLYTLRGEFQKALACFAEHERISRELGDREGTAAGIGRQGVVHSTIGEIESGLRCLEFAITEHRDMRMRVELSELLCEMSTLLARCVEESDRMPEYLKTRFSTLDASNWKTVLLKTARENAEECVAVAREVSRPDIVFNGELALARIDRAEGNASASRDRLLAMVSTHSEPANSAELQYRLWQVTGEERYRSKAVELFESLMTGNPLHHYVECLGQLRESMRDEPSRVPTV